MTKLLFTGGHHNSALATVDWLIEMGLALKFSWIGMKNSPEYSEVSKRPVKFYTINAGKLFRTTSPRYIPAVIVNILKIPFGFIQTFVILIKDRPNLVISFGGFLAVPVVVCSWILRIPAVTHEQTIVIGLANKIISKFAMKIYVSWPIEKYNVSKSTRAKMMYTGLPLRKEILEAAGFRKNLNNKEKIIYVTGGKQGAEFLNNIVLESVDKLLQKYRLIWQCGEKDYEYLNKKLANLSKEKRERIVLKKYFYEWEIGEVLGNCDLIISRGGAHTVYEIGVLKIPAIIIPIPWSSHNEQYLNAKVLEDAGIAMVLDQENLTSTALLTEVQNVLKMKIDSNKLNLKLNGQENLGNEILKILKK